MARRQFAPVRQRYAAVRDMPTRARLQHLHSVHGQWFVSKGVLAAAFMFCLSCTQNMTAIDNRSSSGSGGNGGGCATQTCDGPGQCCPNFECSSKYGRCVPSDAAGGGGASSTSTSSYSYVGPAQPCPLDTNICVSPYPGYQFYCGVIDNTKLCLSSHVAPMSTCHLPTDCGSLHCDSVLAQCKPGPSCKVSGDTCDGGDLDCCTNKCGPDKTCIADDKTCSVIGDSCSTTSDCCSGNLCRKVGATSRCVPTSTCRGLNEVCGTIGCCYGMKCVNDRCVDSCTQRDVQCAKNDECCSHKCAGPATGKTCVALDGCQPLGEKCTSHSDCCSNNCDLEKSRCSTTQTPQPCGQDGEPCSDQWNCCNATYGASCVEDVLSVKRCSSVTVGLGCYKNQDPCDFGVQCCQSPSRCDYDTGANAFLCTTNCKARDENCYRHADCCTNYCSPQGVCDVPD